MQGRNQMVAGVCEFFICPIFFFAVVAVFGLSVDSSDHEKADNFGVFAKWHNRKPEEERAGSPREVCRFLLFFSLQLNIISALRQEHTSTAYA